MLAEILRRAWTIAFGSSLCLSLSTSSALAANFQVTKSGDDGSSGTMRWAIEQLNAAGPGNHSITLNNSVNSISAVDDLPQIDGTGMTIVINGRGSKLNGHDQHRLIFVAAGNVTLLNFNLNNGSADGGDGNGGGGGGGGLGGALFVNNGANVTLSNVNFDSNSAVGGDGGDSLSSQGGGGGGGLGGDGGEATHAGGGGGGGFSADGGHSHGSGGAGGGGVFGDGGNTSSSGGGGGGGILLPGGPAIGPLPGIGALTGGDGGAGVVGGNGGPGFFGGGGGGGEAIFGSAGHGGDGGLLSGGGGGGGSSDNGGDGGDAGSFGGGGGAGNGSSTSGTSGNGGFGGGSRILGNGNRFQHFLQRSRQRRGQLRHQRSGAGPRLGRAGYWPQLRSHLPLEHLRQLRPDAQRPDDVPHRLGRRAVFVVSDISERPASLPAEIR